ncbi:MAG: PorP/SprF family type IX secretion system membrane protein [Bacteroidota bacterium]
MKSIYHSFLLVLILCFASANVWAQDPFFAQIHANRLALSPALAGSQGAPVLAMQYRVQWVRISGHPRQATLAYDSPLKFGKGLNAGFSTQLDYFGTGYTLSAFHLHFAKEWQIAPKHYLRAGLAGGMGLGSINYAKLRFPDQLDSTGAWTPAPTVGFEYIPRVDASLGLSYHNRFFYFIGTIRHLQDNWLVESGEGYYPRLYSATSGVRIPLSEAAINGLGKVYLTPMAHYQVQGPFDIFMFGAALQTKYFQLSTWVQAGERISGGVGTSFGPVQMSYSYDHYLSDLNSGIAGPAHELSFAIRFGGKKEENPDAMPLPRY